MPCLGDTRKCGITRPAKCRYEVSLPFSVAVSRHASQTDTPLGFDVQAYYPRASAAVPQVFVPAKGFRMDARVCIMPMLRCGHYKYILY